MYRPIYGYMYESDLAGPMHSHHIYIRTWNGNMIHAHQVAGATTTDLGHLHHYAGTTEPAPRGMQHTHRYFIQTTIADGHIHEMRGVTGPAIPLPNGRHYHEFQGVTTVSGLSPHSHSYSGRTSQ